MQLRTPSACSLLIMIFLASIGQTTAQEIERLEPVVVTGPAEVLLSNGRRESVPTGSVFTVTDVQGNRVYVALNIDEVGRIHNNHVVSANIPKDVPVVQQIEILVRLGAQAINNNPHQSGASAEHSWRKTRLIVHTAFHETLGFTEQRERGGEPGRGLFQFMPKTVKDVIIRFAYEKNYRTGRNESLLDNLVLASGLSQDELLAAARDLKDKTWSGKGRILEELCTENHWFQTTLFVIQQKNVPEEIPDDLAEMAMYAARNVNAFNRSPEKHRNQYEATREYLAKRPEQFIAETYKNHLGPYELNVASLREPEGVLREAANELDRIRRLIVAERDALKAKNEQTTDSQERDRISDEMEILSVVKATLDTEIYARRFIADAQKRVADGKSVIEWLRALRQSVFPKSRNLLQVRSGNSPNVGVEAGPIRIAALVPIVIAAAQRPGRALRLEDLLPTRGPSGSTRSPTFALPQTRPAQGNAVDALGVDFCAVPGDRNTTIGVALVIKTPHDAYWHDYAMCARFHGHALEDVRPVPLSNVTSDPENAPSFWFSQIHDDRTSCTEAAFHFVAFVNEASREITVDSRWIDKHYSPYWRGPQGQQHDYVLNFQVWASSEENSRELVHSILNRLNQLNNPWTVNFANRQNPEPPSVFVEAAWLQDGVVHLSVWNRLSSPRLAVFHGTRQDSLGGPDIFFEHWRPVHPGRNLLHLPMGSIHNAVVHCEVDGFMDKVFVSVDETRTSPWKAGTHATPVQTPPANRPQIKINWPPANAEVRVLRDLLDMPPDDCRLAVNGTVSGAPEGSSVLVYVCTTDWYEQDPPTTENGLWGARVYLRGEGTANNHRIYARLIDSNGTELAHDVVEGVVRIDEDQGGRPMLNPIEINAIDFDNRSGVFAAGQGITIGGGPDGPYRSGGSASCRVTLPEDASGLRLRLAIWHAPPNQLGKGLHSRNNGGTATISINGVKVHTIVCRHRHMFGDFWPEQTAELGRELPEIGCAANGISGETLTIKIETSANTCMDLRTLIVEPSRR